MSSSVQVLDRIGYAQVVGSAGGGSANAGWFGDGSDGDLVVTGDTPLEVALDEGQIVKQYNNLTIQQGGILRPANRCNGMILLIKGNLTLNGTITVDKCAPLLNSNETEAVKEKHIVLCGSMTGGNGGGGGASSNNSAQYGLTPGTGGAGFALGGGFGGGSAAGSGQGPSSKYYWGYNGGNGDPRPPIGTPIPYPSPTGVGKTTMYGVGGSGAHAGEGVVGGSGPGGSGAALTYDSPDLIKAHGNNGDAIGGGALWIFVKGKVRINTTGKITANGGAGAKGAYASGRSSNTSGGGGGAGGGIIALVHTGDYINQGSITANGGSGGERATTSITCYAGEDGTAGTVKVCTINELT